MITIKKKDMENIHILPTDKSSRLSIKDGVLILHRLQWRKGTQHIYITSDEEIKDNDYITDGYLVWKWKDDSSLLGRKKIILTTDQDLIKDGVQAIDDEFLKWFVKNPSCERVEVTEYLDSGFSYGYKIIIPKEEPKQICEYCKIEITKYGCGCGTEKPKQETLEEELLEQIKFCLICKNDSQAIRLLEKYAFEKQQQIYNDLKLQQEQIYNQIKQLHDNENITGFSKRAYAQCLDIVEHLKQITNGNKQHLQSII